MKIRLKLRKFMDFWNFKMLVMEAAIFEFVSPVKYFDFE